MPKSKGSKGMSAKKPKIVVIKPKTKSQKPINFEKGGLHESLNVPAGKKIPPGKKKAALEGKYGPKAKKQAVFAFKGALATGRKTVSKKKKK